MNSIVLTTAIFDACVAEASSETPLETGGIFLGRRGPGGAKLVEYMIGAGPNAKRTETWLEVDHEWQNSQIIMLAEEGRNVEFLGGWHTHPSASSGQPSRTDRKALLKLSQFPALRCDDPAMLIFFPNADTWDVAGWELQRDGYRWPFMLVKTIPISVDIASNGSD
ncbi:M67 family metallopeptidase [Aurantimonas coralicida]|uniref:Mov34/MPN/PAD-1 family protein n=1 Tax=Aurantimonas coralicida TaxID=182270 RepID=UPI001D197D6E|nr:Mov34/MPN/PAD-1 family protein [Aurantimonas coralicida]MCC4298174.1 Mov34/MPN/PAD-1 family protein [Aurantimonas coralicida]